MSCVENECLSGTHQCDYNAICTDTKTGFDCTCNEGFMGDGKTCYGGAESQNCVKIFSAQGTYADNGMGKEAAENYGFKEVENGVNMMKGFLEMPIPSVIQIRWPERDMSTQVFDVKEGAEWEHCKGSHNCASLDLDPVDGSPKPLYLILPRSNAGGLCINNRTDRVPYTFTCDGDNGQTSQVGMIDGENAEMGCVCDHNPDEENINCFIESFGGTVHCMTENTYAELWACFQDIDQCATDTDDCDENATCENHSSGFSCTCRNGFTGDGKSCEDVDECAEGTDNCDDYSQCINAIGGYSCTCKDGFFFDKASQTCKDIDECIEDTHDCLPLTATCINEPGTYSCNCNLGYRGDGKYCTDINECTERLDKCDKNTSICVNEPGLYSCNCRKGYYSDGGMVCSDVNECKGPNRCRENSTCQEDSISGTFRCECKTGFTKKEVCSDTCSLYCADIDECEEGIHNCHGKALCTNTPGSYSCSCLKGYKGTGRICEDVDECALPWSDPDSNDCDLHAFCKNEEGGFSCDCYAGYKGDGRYCQRLGCRQSGAFNFDPNAKLDGECCFGQETIDEYELTVDDLKTDLQGCLNEKKIIQMRWLENMNFGELENMIPVEGDQRRSLTEEEIINEVRHLLKGVIPDKEIEPLVEKIGRR
eukprot:UN24586